MPRVYVCESAFLHLHTSVYVSVCLCGVLLLVFWLVGLRQARQASLIRCGYGFGCCGCALFVCATLFYCWLYCYCCWQSYLVAAKFPFFLLMKFIFWVRILLGTAPLFYCQLWIELDSVLLKAIKPEGLLSM